jgi:hypothetical protein
MQNELLLASANAAGIPAGELQIDSALIDALLTAQFPDLALLPSDFVAVGWGITRCIVSATHQRYACRAGNSRRNC